jgi:hypothetical protein
MRIIEYLNKGFDEDVIDKLIDPSDSQTEIESVKGENDNTLLNGEPKIVKGLDSEINKLLTLSEIEIKSVYSDMKIQKILLHLIFILAVIQYYTSELEKDSSVEDKESIKMELRKYLGYLKKFLKLVAPIFLKKYNSVNDDKNETLKLLNPYIVGIVGKTNTIRLTTLATRIRNIANSKLSSWGISKTIGRTTQKLRSGLDSFGERIGETSGKTIRRMGRYMGVRGGKRKNKSSKNVSRKMKKSRKG